MKKVVLGLVLICLAATAGAQTWSEWFRQKKTQIKYLVAQIGAYQVYDLSLGEGYRLAKGGLGVIHQIKEGDFHLHEEHFTAFKRINPNVQGYWKVAGIVSLETGVMKRCNGTRKRAANSDQFSTGEKKYVGQVINKVIQDCLDEVEALQAVMTNDAASMSDDARLKRIDGLYEAAQESDAFAQHFDGQVKLLALGRGHEAGDTKTMRSLFGIH